MKGKLSVRVVSPTNQNFPEKPKQPNLESNPYKRACYAFMKTTQCVPIFFPLLCPNSGFSGVSFRMSRTGKRHSFHLNIKTPSGFSTRKHSEKPSLSISRQSPCSDPYFFVIWLVPVCSMCGGSNTTKWKVLSGNSIFEKSPNTQGSITLVFVPHGYVST